jgi:hypothetical protein
MGLLYLLPFSVLAAVSRGYSETSVICLVVWQGKLLVMKTCAWHGVTLIGWCACAVHYWNWTAPLHFYIGCLWRLPPLSLYFCSSFGHRYPFFLSRQQTFLLISLLCYCCVNMWFLFLLLIITLECMKRVSSISLLIYHSVNSQHWSRVKVGYCYFTKNVLIKVLTGMCQTLHLAQECKFDVG